MRVQRKRPCNGRFIKDVDRSSDGQLMECEYDNLKSSLVVHPKLPALEVNTAP